MRTACNACSALALAFEEEEEPAGEGADASFTLAVSGVEGVAVVGGSRRGVALADVGSEDTEAPRGVSCDLQ